MSELAVGSLKGLAANDFVIDVAAGSTLNVPPPAILQVVRATDTTNRTTSSGTFTDVPGMSVSITPSSGTSRIIVSSQFTLFIGRPSGVSLVGFCQLTDGANNPVIGAENVRLSDDNAGNIAQPFTLLGEDIPGSTSPVTYKVRFRLFTGASMTLQNSDSAGQIHAMEVAG